MDSAGRPFLLQGDSPWSLIVQVSLEDAQLYLDTRRAQGFNAIVVELIEHHFADDAPRNFYDDEPFLTPGDFSTPNPTYFDHVDDVLELAQERGFVVLLAPAYLGFDGGGEGWYQEMLANGPDVLRGYGRYLGQRYGRFDNIIWLEGGDYTPGEDGLRLVRAVVEGIKETASQHLHAAHWGRETSGLDVAVDWIDIDTVYTSDLVYPKSFEAYARATPHILLESFYEDDNRGITTQTIRSQAYSALLTGAMGQVFGNGDIWRFNGEWQESLSTPGSCSMIYLQKLFSALSWYELVPDVDNRFLVGGRGTFGADDYALAAASPAEPLAIVYLPTAREIQVDLSALDGAVRLRFYDPTEGTFHDGPAVPAQRGVITLRPPGSNVAGDSDWLLVFDRAR